MSQMEVIKKKPEIKITAPGPQGPPGPMASSDVVAEVLEEYLAGNPIPPGPEGPPGPPGPSGGSSSYYLHPQNLPSATWHIVHNLGRKPNVSVTDSVGNEVEGSVHHINTNELEVSFSAAFGGEAYLS